MTHKIGLKSRYFTVSEAAKKLGVTRQTVSRWIAKDKIKAERIGREVLIDKLDLRKFIRKRWVKSVRSELIKGLLNDFCPEPDFFENWQANIGKASKQFPFSIIYAEPITFEYILPNGKREQSSLPIRAITIDENDNVKWYLPKKEDEKKVKE